MTANQGRPVTIQAAKLISIDDGADDRLPQVLIPYDRREAMSVRAAAKAAGYCESTIKRWCGLYFIGRRVVGGHWQVSRVALAMLLDGNEAALRTYLSGDRKMPAVIEYFKRFGIVVAKTANLAGAGTPAEAKPPSAVSPLASFGGEKPV
jgi:hypothetical protein